MWSARARTKEQEKGGTDHSAVAAATPVISGSTTAISRKLKKNRMTTHAVTKRVMPDGVAVGVKVGLYAVGAGVGTAVGKYAVGSGVGVGVGAPTGVAVCGWAVGRIVCDGLGVGAGVVGLTVGGPTGFTVCDGRGDGAGVGSSLGFIVCDGRGVGAGSVGAGAGFTVCDGLGVGTPVGAFDAGGTTGGIVCDGLGVGTAVGWDVAATSALHASSTTTRIVLLGCEHDFLLTRACATNAGPSRSGPLRIDQVRSPRRGAREAPHRRPGPPRHSATPARLGVPALDL